MANIQAAGGAVALVSALTLEDIRLLEEHGSEALVLYEGEKEVFRVGTASEGGITPHGVCFSSATRDGARLAEVTLDVPADVTDLRDFAAKEIGLGLFQLRAIETQASTAIGTLRQQLDEVRDAVIVPGAA